MAPSQNQTMETLEYTHKKFNCGYSHKKLGLRLMRRNSQEEEEVLSQQFPHPATNSTNNCSKPRLFRPYDLDSSSKTIKQKTTSTTTTPQASQNPATTTTPNHYMEYYALQPTVQQSQEQYALKLQRQRAALYMKHVMQFYENGNGWPSVHPNAINNPAFYPNC
ncbi:hypothetical protein FF38_02544 [Lucilia cuprina]|uniref:Uncharacterized protein n=1 Tax=Lucilia cuprina TaxID=7375 RepID=A0A0L0BZ34_LUCCU|nr:hypothetical protein CVS40_7658 [Lucilia cuprina]KNC25317.1 hypothetical protein FF38_02544 [Lucilia cuprina]